MLYLARYYAFEGAILILGPWNGDAPANAELVGLGILDDGSVRVADEIMAYQRERNDAS